MSERVPVWKQENLTLPPTTPNTTYTLTDIGTTRGGTAISAIREAYHDTWGHVALVLMDEYGYLQTYAFLRGNPIKLSHVPDDAFNREEHHIQTNGIRSNYEFIRALNATPRVYVAAWENTRFTEVVQEEVWFP